MPIMINPFNQQAPLPATNSKKYLSNRGRVPLNVYMKTLSELIANELRTAGQSDGLESIYEQVIKSSKIYTYDMLAVLFVAVELSKIRIMPTIVREPYSDSMEAAGIPLLYLIEMLRSQGRLLAGRQKERQESRGEARMRPDEDREAVRQMVEEEARRAREQAERQAQARVNEAMKEVDRLRREAEEEKLKAQRLREEIEHSAQRMKDQARAQAEQVYAEQIDQFRPRAVREMLDGFQTEDQKLHNQAGEERRALCEALNRARGEVCEEITRMQAGLNDLFGNMRSQMNTELIKWREQIYKLETMDLATCYVSLTNILSSIDRKIAEEILRADDREQPVNEVVQSIRRNLGKFEKQLRNAMLGVGLDVYIPQAKERFDPALHTLADSVDEDECDLEGSVISGCKRPGVRYLDAGTNTFEAMIRAEVTIEAGGRAE